MRLGQRIVVKFERVLARVSNKLFLLYCKGEKRPVFYDVG